MELCLTSVKFEEHSTFGNNCSTAIHIVNENVDMSESSLESIKDCGIRGGAIAVVGEFSVILGRARGYKFLNNTAMDKGDAVYSIQKVLHSL